MTVNASALTGGSSPAASFAHTTSGASPGTKLIPSADGKAPGQPLSPAELDRLIGMTDQGRAVLAARKS
jgi:hypothetical protein